MPTQKDKGVIRDKKQNHDQVSAIAHLKMTDLIKMYETLCEYHNVPAFAPLKKQMKLNMEESKLQSMFLFDPSDRTDTKYWEDEMLPDIFNKEIESKKRIVYAKNQNNLIKILPLLESVKDMRYTYIHELIVWNMMVEFNEICCLTYLLNKKIYQLSKIELINCLLDNKSISKLVPAINKCSTLRELILDYNEFGDEGCHTICAGLKGCTWLYQLSLNHCAITRNCGLILGEVIATSTIRELFLEGNRLHNEGVIIMIGVINAAIQNQIVETTESIDDQKNETYEDLTVLDPLDPESIGDEKVAKILSKKKKKKKAKTKTVFLTKGPEISKLNIANNNIGRFGIGDSYASVFSMQILKNLIFTCKDLEEIDLFANDIGDVAARLILEGLTLRKIQKYPQIGVRMCHLVNQDIYDSISKLAPGSKKKKRGSKKK